MSKIFLSNRELEKVKTFRLCNSLKSKRWFENKRLNHLNNVKLRAFYAEYLSNIKYSDVLLDIRFKSSFAIYLFVFLKSKAKPFELESLDDYSISQPIDVNFGQIADMSKMSRNTVKKAFRELVKVGLIFYRTGAKGEHHNSTKSIMLLNDKHLIGYDRNAEKVIYSINSEKYNIGQ